MNEEELRKQFTQETGIPATVINIPSYIIWLEHIIIKKQQHYFSKN